MFIHQKRSKYLKILTYLEYFNKNIQFHKIHNLDKLITKAFSAFMY